ncbi:hypothetical protein KEM54_005261 [Ascosphaera aggregata]|nr:hypothetical protein KEM54_005261 [Ascosphaera aggregata]
MAGKLLILEGDKLTVVDEIRGHGKFAVMVTAYEEQQQQSGTDGRGTLWLATAGWDARVLVYKLEYQAVEGIQLTKLSESFTYELVLPTNPECILITCDQHTGNLVLVLSRKDSSFLEYYLLNLPFEMKLDAGMIHLGRQNLAPHSSSWTPFSPAYFLISPTEPGLLAVATSSEPHMKIIIVRMLIPSLPDKSPTTALAHAPTQDTDSLPSGLARLSLLAQSREDSAIVLQCTTSAPQTPYSTPQLAWRSDGSGIWVNGDDGVVRGVDVRSGKVVAILGAEKEGHEPGSKIRCIWSGLVVRETGNVEEWVVSGGFDRKLIVWKAK